MSLRYEQTGEFRPPRCGEWFETRPGVEERARFDFAQQSFPILRMIFEPAPADTQKTEG